MLSRKMVIIFSLVLLLFFNVIALFVSGRHYYSLQVSSRTFPRPGQYFIAIVAPFQKGLTQTIHFAERLWEHYFYLVSVAKENEELKNCSQQGYRKKQ
jgi:rod shape-determining protein MreC